MLEILNEAEPEYIALCFGTLALTPAADSNPLLRTRKSDAERQVWCQGISPDPECQSAERTQPPRANRTYIRAVGLGLCERLRSLFFPPAILEDEIV